MRYEKINAPVKAQIGYMPIEFSETAVEMLEGFEFEAYGEYYAECKIRGGIIIRCYNPDEIIPGRKAFIGIYSKAIKGKEYFNLMINKDFIAEELRPSLSEITRIPNVEVRQLVVELLGNEWLASQALPVLDENEDSILYRADGFNIVRVTCPSTGKLHYLRVSPECETISQAVAWTFSMSDAEYQPKEEK